MGYVGGNENFTAFFLLHIFCVSRSLEKQNKTTFKNIICSETNTAFGVLPELEECGFYISSISSLCSYHSETALSRLPKTSNGHFSKASLLTSLLILYVVVLLTPHLHLPSLDSLIQPHGLNFHLYANDPQI